MSGVIPTPEPEFDVNKLENLPLLYEGEVIGRVTSVVDSSSGILLEFWLDPGVEKKLMLPMIGAVSIKPEVYPTEILADTPMYTARVVPRKGVPQDVQGDTFD